MRNNKLKIGFNIWFVVRIIGIIFLCYLQYLAIRWLAVEGGLFLYLTYGILILYILQLFYIIYSIIGVNREYGHIDEFIFWGGIIIIIFNIPIFIRNQILLFPISGIGDLLLIVWLLNHNLLPTNIHENKIYSIKRINGFVAKDEKQILNVIIGAVIVILVVEIIIALYLVVYQYSQSYF